MGGSGSKADAASAAGGSGTVPQFTPESVELLCQQAYAAGAEDAGNHYMQLVDSTRRQDMAVGAAACIMTLWFTFTYGSTRVARERAFATEHLEAQKELLVVAHNDLARAKMQVQELTTGLESRDALIERQRAELSQAKKARRAMLTGLKRVTRRSTRLQAEMASMQGSLRGTRNMLYAAGAALTLIWIETTWSLVRQGRLEARRPSASEEGAHASS